MESLFESQLVAARDKVVLSSLKRVLEGDDELDKMVESGTRKCEEFIKTGRLELEALPRPSPEPEEVDEEMYSSLQVMFDLKHKLSLEKQTKAEAAALEAAKPKEIIKEVEVVKEVIKEVVVEKVVEKVVREEATKPETREQEVQASSTSSSTAPAAARGTPLAQPTPKLMEPVRPTTIREEDVEDGMEVEVEPQQVTRKKTPIKAAETLETVAEEPKEDEKQEEEVIMQAIPQLANPSEEREMQKEAAKADAKLDAEKASEMDTPVPPTPIDFDILGSTMPAGSSTQEPPRETTTNAVVNRELFPSEATDELRDVMGSRPPRPASKKPLGATPGAPATPGLGKKAKTGTTPAVLRPVLEEAPFGSTPLMQSNATSGRPPFGNSKPSLNPITPAIPAGTTKLAQFGNPGSARPRSALRVPVAEAEDTETKPIEKTPRGKENSENVNPNQNANGNKSSKKKWNLAGSNDSASFMTNTLVNREGLPGVVDPASFDVNPAMKTLYKGEQRDVKKPAALVAAERAKLQQEKKLQEKEEKRRRREEELRRRHEEHKRAKEMDKKKVEKPATAQKSANPNKPFPTPAKKMPPVPVFGTNKGIPQPGTRPPEASPGKKTKKPPLASPTPRSGKKARKPPLASPTPRSKAKAAAAAALANNAPLTPGVLATQAGGPMPAALRYSPMRKITTWKRLRGIQPKKASDNYVLSDKEDSDEEDMQPRKKVKKPQPPWAKDWMKVAMEQRRVDPDSIFGPRMPVPDLEAIFGCEGRVNKYQKREGSSSNWEDDKLRKDEIDDYKKQMGQEKALSNVWTQE